MGNNLKKQRSHKGKKQEDGPQHGGMAQRGVSRPMAEKETRDRMRQMEGGMGEEQREQMLTMHYRQTLWIYWLLLLLGFWMILAPLTFDYRAGLAQPSGGRPVWLSTDARVLVMRWSDLVSGLLLVLFGWRSLTPNRPVSLWICCLVGVWLSAAPLIFWAPNGLVYLNDTLVGVLVIALTILIPGMPNMIMYMKMGPEQPPGWTYNPSSWAQRWIMIALAFAGWLVSRYLAAFQLGYLETAWDPFFGESTKKVLNSKMSHSWPISDAGLGTLSYTFEFLMGWMGSPARWRTMPWMVAFFGFLVIPLGLTHIFLVISQPVVVGHWCTLCLLAAAIMLPMIPLEMDEVIAMFQFMGAAKNRGTSLWQAFWKGGAMEGGGPDERSPEVMAVPQQPGRVLRASIWGMSFPWTLMIAAALGIWLMLTPAVLLTSGLTADLEHVGGALILTVSVISMGEVARVGRYLNIPLALMVGIAPWLSHNAPWAARLIDTGVALAVIALALPKGPQTEHYGSWDKWVR